MSPNRRQELFIDGIDTSLEMTRMAYARLFRAVLECSQLTDDSEPRALLRNAILLDSWALIDITNRLRVLVRQTPGLTHNAPVNLFLRSTDDVETLRNFVQHLPNEVMRLADKGYPLWGYVTWLWASPEMQQTGKVACGLLVPGPLAKSKGYRMVNPAGKTVRFPVDHISLSAGETTVNLSERTRSCEAFAKRFSAGLERARSTRRHQTPDDPDALLQIALSTHDEPPAND